MSNKTCKICNRQLVGRSDKVFCSVQCKNMYHVTLRKVTSEAVHSINNILHRNRSILLELLGKHAVQKKMNRRLLDKKRFNYKYHTHMNKNSKGKIYYFVYDIAWMPFSDDEVLLIRRRPVREG